MEVHPDRKYYRYKLKIIVDCFSLRLQQESKGILRDISDIGAKLCCTQMSLVEGDLIRLTLDNKYHFEVVSVGLGNECIYSYGLKILSNEESDFIAWTREQQRKELINSRKSRDMEREIKNMKQVKEYKPIGIFKRIKNLLK